MVHITLFCNVFDDIFIKQNYVYFDFDENKFLWEK